MYCSRCAAQIGEGVDFCSTCGERVNDTELAEGKTVQSKMLDKVANAAIFIGVGGLLFLVGLVVVLLNRTVPIQIVVLLAAMYLAAWFGIMYKLVSQMSSLVDANLEESSAGSARDPRPVELPPRVAPQLEAQTQEPASVIDQTTRDLEAAGVLRGR